MTDKRLIPEIISGYELAEGKGWFSVIMPESTINLVLNPSIEIDTTGYAAVAGATISRTITEQYQGIYSLKVVAAAAGRGVSYTTSTLTSGTTYTFSTYIKGVRGHNYYLRVTRGGATIAQTKFHGTGNWQREKLTFKADATATFLLNILVIASGTFYTDAWQLEAKEYMTTYCDGDMTGFVVGERPYRWGGNHHLSVSSRADTTASGGREINLSDLGFHVTGFVGLGMAPVSNIMTPLSTGGEYYQKSRYEGRDFSLIGVVAGRGFMEFTKFRKMLINAFHLHRTAISQPMLMLFSYRGEDGAVHDFYIQCLYSGGLEGSIDNLYMEKIEIRFHMTDTYIAGRDGTEANEIGYRSISNTTGAAQNFAFRYPDASIVNVGGATHFWGSYGIIDFNNILYVTEEAALAGARHVWTFDGASAFNAFGNALDDTVDHSTPVWGLHRATNGNLHAFGKFNTPGECVVARIEDTPGVPSTGWRPIADNSLRGAYGVTQVIALTSTRSKRLYALCERSGLTNQIYYCENCGVGNNWALLITEPADGTSIKHIVADPVSEDLYLFGDFTTRAGVASTYGALRYDGSAYHDVSTGLEANLTGAAMSVNGAARGMFGYNASSIYRYSGSGSWSKTAVISGGGTLSKVIVGDDDMAYCLFALLNRVANPTYRNKINSVECPSGIAKFIGNYWYPVDLTLGTGKGAQSIQNLYVRADGTMCMQVASGGGTTSSWSELMMQRATVRIDSGEQAAQFVIIGPYELISIENMTNGQMLYFRELYVEYGETVTITLDKGSVSAFSNTRGSINSKLGPGTSPVFRLDTGDNVISVALGDNYKAFNDSNYITYLVLNNATEGLFPTRQLFLRITDVAGEKVASIYRDSPHTDIICTNSAQPEETYMVPQAGEVVGGFIVHTAPGNVDCFVMFGTMYLVTKRIYESLDEAINAI